MKMNNMNLNGNHYPRFLSLVLLFSLQSVCFGQDGLLSTTPVGHVEVEFFQNGEQVDCVDHTLPFEIVVNNPHPDQPAYLSISDNSGGNSMYTPNYLTNYNGEEGVIVFPANFFNPKIPQLAAGLQYQVYVIYPNNSISFGELFIIPFCVNQFNSSDVIQNRNNNSISSKSKYFVFNTSGQKIIELSEFDSNRFSFDMIAGIYFVFKSEDQKLEFVGKYWQN